jgi:hypothetical protein
MLKVFHFVNSSRAKKNGMASTAADTKFQPSAIGSEDLD